MPLVLEKHFDDWEWRWRQCRERLTGRVKPVVCLVRAIELSRWCKKSLVERGFCSYFPLVNGDNFGNLQGRSEKNVDRAKPVW
jgi:hypothetical protein